MCQSADGGRRRVSGGPRLVARSVSSVDLSLPWRVRLLLLRDKRLLSRVLSHFQRVVFAYQRRQARNAGARNPLCGSVTFVHHFDSLLRPNVHFHSFLPDGVFHEPAHGKLAFSKLPPPSDADIDKLLLRVAKRVEQSVSLLENEPEDDDERAQALHVTALESAQKARTRSLFSISPQPRRPRCSFMPCGCSSRATHCMPM
jgi:hypothetical protein